MTLKKRLDDYERKLRELNNPAWCESTPEVRAMLIEICKNAIADVKQDIAENKED